MLHFYPKITFKGINPAFGDIMDISEGEWDKPFDVNVKAAFLLTQLAVPIIKESGFVISTNRFQHFL
jgi:NAD(P)-dependent dehydrogenase (short-subunit alcohol dehydrogenase family)